MSNQEVALQSMESGENTLVTAGAGRGKSYIIRKFCEKYGKDTAVCAPTGIAALNINGTTCHKLFGLPLGIPMPYDATTVTKNMSKIFPTGLIKRVIIDEMPMLRADMLDLVDMKLKTVMKNNKPFGGIQLIGVGDYGQLEPIVHWTEEEYYADKYSTPFNFASRSFNFNKVGMTKVYRQDDEYQINILDSLRFKDENYRFAVDEINDLARPYDPSEQILHLSCYKRDADVINTLWYDRIEGQSRTYDAVYTGKWHDPIAEKELELKIGCRVILCANDPDGYYVNGDRGEVTYMDHNVVEVRLDSGRVIPVVPFTWESYKYSGTKDKLAKEVDATYTQIPLKLGWAQTVHKAQGMTLDNVALDFGDGCFSHGQAYVAVSRIKDLTNIRLVRKMRYKDVICRAEVKEFYENLRL